jgi:hypothetical protein
MATAKVQAMAEEKARKQIDQMARDLKKIMEKLGIEPDEVEEELPGEIRRRRQEEMDAQTATDQEAQNKRMQERREQEEARQREIQAAKEAEVTPAPSRQSAEAANQEKPGEESKLSQASRNVARQVTRK